MEILAKKFEEELKLKMLRAKKECKYNPTRFNQMLATYGGVETVLAPGTHSHFESGKFSQFWPEPGTNPAQWVRLKTPFRVHPKQPN